MNTSTATVAASELLLPVEDIRVHENVRELDDAHVEILAQSMKLRGVLVPLIVRAVDDGYELVAGYHRIAAAQRAGLTDVPVVLRDNEGSTADAAAENVARKQLSPLEEARAVQAMLDEGYTPDGAAQALGWTRQLVTARAKILRVSPAGQELIGTGAIPVSAIENLLTIADASPTLAEGVIAAIAAGDCDGARLVGSPGWAIGRGLEHAETGTFAAYLNQIQPQDVERLRLGKKVAAQVKEAEELHKQIERYAYGPPAFAFSEIEVDRARAAQVLLEFPESHYGSAPVITDRATYRELAKDAIARTVEELRAKASAKSESKRSRTAKQHTPREELDREHRADVRELARRAHNTNLDLGRVLLSELATVKPDDLDVARFFAYGLLGPETKSYLGSGDHVALTIAANGLRLVIDTHRTETTPVLKNGRRGKTKIVYAEPEEALAWLWRYVDGARSAGELYGRVLVVFAAAHYASQLALPASKRRSSVLPSSRKDTARKAFERLTKKLLPATHTQLQRAIAAEARAYDVEVAELDQRTARSRKAEQHAQGDNAEGDEILEDLDAEDDARPESEFSDEPDDRQDGDA